MLLQIMSFTRDVRRHLNTVSQSDPGHLTKSRVRLLGRDSPHLKTDASLLRAAFAMLCQPLFVRVVREEERGRLRLLSRLLARTTDELIDGRH